MNADLPVLQPEMDLDIHFTTWPAKGAHYALVCLSEDQAARFKYRLTFSLPELAPSDAPEKA